MRVMHTAGDDSRTLAWAHGRAEVQRLGAMLAPVVFRAPGRADFQPMHVAPWARERGSDGLPGILRRLRGEWPCVPFGRVDALGGVPPGWQRRQPDDEWGHGYASHHEWCWSPSPGSLTLELSVLYPEESVVHRLTRRITAVPDEAALDIALRIEARRSCILPVALHPTMRLDLGRVALRVPHRGPGLTYPVGVAPDISRLASNHGFADLAHAPAADGAEIDLSRYPQAVDSEELVQLLDATGPVVLDYPDQRWAFEIDWDRALLPDVMLWVSHRGRSRAPWNGRHLALGVEPLNGVFDLGRIACPPGDHPLATRRGIVLDPAEPSVIRYSLRARAMVA
jgi:hypothetical protein